MNKRQKKKMINKLGYHKYLNRKQRQLVTYMASRLSETHGTYHFPELQGMKSTDVFRFMKEVYDAYVVRQCYRIRENNLSGVRNGYRIYHLEPKYVGYGFIIVGQEEIDKYIAEHVKSTFMPTPHLEFEIEHEEEYNE